MSESSLKRWADRGFLSVTRTAGGHRRISIPEAIRFIRDRELVIQDPMLLGLPGSAETYSPDGGNVSDTFLHALQSGDLDVAQSCILARYMSGSSIAEIGDGPVKSALQFLGAQGHEGDSIIVEHRATELCVQLIHQLRSLARPNTFSFTAVGGGVSGDPYVLPSLLVASVIAEHGGDATNFGPNTPFDAMRHQSTLLEKSKRPDLVWISVSETHDPRSLSADISTFAGECSEAGMQVVVGGRAVSELTLDQISGLTVHATLTSLSGCVQQLGSRNEVA
ncbi:MAG: hypothetical protein P8L37_05385 [Phycisphaerales bacterium]|nr:hypothetical protein [Phycisphaerales bacterium]